MIIHQINVWNFDLLIFPHITCKCHIFIALISCLKSIMWVSCILVTRYGHTEYDFVSILLLTSNRILHCFYIFTQ